MSKSKLKTEHSGYITKVPINTFFFPLENIFVLSDPEHSLKQNTLVSKYPCTAVFLALTDYVTVKENEDI